MLALTPSKRISALGALREQGWLKGGEAAGIEELPGPRGPPMWGFGAEGGAGSQVGGGLIWG